MDLKPHDRRSGELVPADQVKALGDEWCADKGASLQGDPQAREAAGKAVLTFLQQVFKP